MDLQGTEDDPLQAALANAFADSPILAPRTQAAASTSTSHSAQSDPLPDQETEEGGDDFWKKEYDQLLTGWRKESAVAREKAEEERERWRIIREQEAKRERERARHIRTDRKEPGWESLAGSPATEESKAVSKQDNVEEGGRTLVTVGQAVASVHEIPGHHVSPSTADARDLVTGETSRGQDVDSIESLLPRPEPHSSEYVVSYRDSSSATAPQSNADDQGLSSSRTWEEIPSLDSSFPSLSFPDRSSAVSSEPHERPPYQQPSAPPSVTLAIFDSSLSRRTRVLALASSLAINMLLPFVNGVMLGFGEIFAKNIVSFFGFQIPGTGVGLRATGRRK